jgi:CubicO group peptidase (beta-lactamase class C family)
MACISGLQWLTEIGPDSFLRFSIMLLPTLGAAIRWGRIPGAVTLVLMTFLAWQLWGVSSVYGPHLLWGVILIFVFSNWKRFKLAVHLQGEGRLAWQGWELGSHSMLWHNGMVGGSASYVGLVPELEIGVVVLTNTARSVDAIGDKIMSQLVKLKEDELREKESDS